MDDLDAACGRILFAVGAVLVALLVAVVLGAILAG